MDRRRTGDNRKDPTTVISVILVAVLVVSVAFYAVVAIATIKKPENFNGESQEGEVSENDDSVEGQETQAEGETEADVSQESFDINDVFDETTGNADESRYVEIMTVDPNEPQELIGFILDSEESTGKTSVDSQISRLSEDLLNAISTQYDTTLLGFGTDIDPPADENNRPLHVAEQMSHLDGTDVDARFYCADENTKQVAITFQEGMETGYTLQALQILKNYNVKSTFYVSGYYVEKTPDCVAQILSDGHEIGSHSYDCPDAGIATLSLYDQMEDAIKLQEYMHEHYNYTMKKYNYNSGVWSVASAVMFDKMGYDVCFCSFNYADFNTEEEFNADEVLLKLEEGLHNGCVYCFHLTNPVTVRILPGLIEYCKDQGYEFVQLQ